MVIGWQLQNPAKTNLLFSQIFVHEKFALHGQKEYNMKLAMYSPWSSGMGIYHASYINGPTSKAWLHHLCLHFQSTNRSLVSPSKFGFSGIVDMLHSFSMNNLLCQQFTSWCEIQDLFPCCRNAWNEKKMSSTLQWQNDIINFIKLFWWWWIKRSNSSWIHLGVQPVCLDVQLSCLQQ